MKHHQNQTFEIRHVGTDAMLKDTFLAVTLQNLPDLREILC